MKPLYRIKMDSKILGSMQVMPNDIYEVYEEDEIRGLLIRVAPGNGHNDSGIMYERDYWWVPRYAVIKKLSLSVLANVLEKIEEEK